MSFVLLIDTNGGESYRAYREEEGAVRFKSRAYAWQSADYITQCVIFGDEKADTCTCEYDSDEGCPTCTYSAHIQAFIRDEITCGSGTDPEFVDEYLPGEVVRVQVQPIAHYHVYRGDLENGAGNPIIDLEDALQVVSDMVNDLADEWDQMAYAHGHEGDRLQHADQPADSQYAKAWKLTMEASRLRTISQNFDLATRREAPLFQGEDGQERWQGTLQHLMSTYLHMFKDTDSGVVLTQVGNGSVCVHHHDIPECWEEQEF